MKKIKFLPMISTIIIFLTIVSVTPQTKRAAKSIEQLENVKNIRHHPLSYLQKQSLSYDKIFDRKRELKEVNYHYLSGHSNAMVPANVNCALKPEEIVVMQAIIEDFQVNDDTMYGWNSQPAISADGDGNFVICWLYSMNWIEFDIYAQRYASNGATLGAFFKVNEYTINGFYSVPAISVDDLSNFVICWTDNRNGDTDIYAQRYASNGVALGVNFKVNDDIGNTEQTYPAISTDGDGNFTICWQDTRNGEDFDIYVQRYSSNGSSLGDNFKVNDDFGNTLQKHPAISCDYNGNFVICWMGRPIFFS